ncbi:MATH domain and coiled-coil domain-containing protein [Cardamine amara subsp. amara]|uniref:MATH domain and coiled-coil domain-containing protein n=1 Tax=Cardamine amara subsp. amara TaxID=228776 RepID=A0ABD1BEZ1_CARAN
MGSSVTYSTVVKNWREHPPFSYSLKINKISELNIDKYESHRFSSGGYNWRLVIYPKGNEKDNGKGFISMYVKLDNTCLSSTKPMEVFAYLMFFVYNKKENKYFTIQDVEVKRFNALRTVWGLSQVVSLETFNKPENGYIFDGEQCEFGVDVMVASPSTKWEVVSFNEKLYFPKFSWSVKNFSVLKDKFYLSNRFSMGGREWDLQLYPKGDSNGAEGKWLSIFLRLADNKTLMTDAKIYVRALLKIVDPRGSNHLTNEINNWYTETSKVWGFSQCISLDKLRKTYLDLEDTLNVEIEFKVVSVTKLSA